MKKWWKRCMRRIGFVATLLLIGGVLGIAGHARFADRFHSSVQRVRSKLTRTRTTETVGDPRFWIVADGYEMKDHSRGLSYPVRIVFHPNAATASDGPFYYVAELYGQVKMVDRAGEVSVLAEDLLNFKPEAPAEMGLMGMDINADATAMFLTMAYWDESAGVYRNKVERLSLSDGGTRVADRSVLLDMKDESTVASYQILFVRIGPDHLLYVGVGRGEQGANAQAMDRFAGKILRMDQSGKAVPSNPFYRADQPTAPASYVYALGVRNPFDLAWDPLNGSAIVSDVGPGLDRIIRLQRGRNYCFGMPGTGDDQMRSNALYTWGPGGSFAPTGVSIVRESIAGASGEYHGLYMGLFGPVLQPDSPHGKQLIRFELDAEGYIAGAVQTIVQYQGPFFSSISDVTKGPDGLYFADVYGPGHAPQNKNGVIYRLRRTTSTREPGQEIPAAAEKEGSKLFAQMGCFVCHDLSGDNSFKEGPSLHGLNERLIERLNSDAYQEQLHELAAREGEYFLRQRPVYEELLTLTDSDRVRRWFSLHLKDPRFDHPESKMPAYGHLTEEQVQALYDFLFEP